MSVVVVVVVIIRFSIILGNLDLCCCQIVRFQYHMSVVVVVVVIICFSIVLGNPALSSCFSCQIASGVQQWDFCCLFWPFLTLLLLLLLLLVLLLFSAYFLLFFFGVDNAEFHSCWYWANSFVIIHYGRLHIAITVVGVVSSNCCCCSSASTCCCCWQHVWPAMWGKGKIWIPAELIFCLLGAISKTPVVENFCYGGTTGPPWTSQKVDK